MKKVLILAATAMSAAMIAGCSQKNDAAKSGSSTSSAISASVAPASVERKQEGALTSRAEPINAAPLGLEVGYANMEGVKAKLGSITQLTDEGTNKYSGGTVLSSDGSGTGVDGIKRLSLTFDKDNVLVAVIMTLPKDPKAMYKQLASKYKTVETQIDNHMNNGKARLEKGDTFIQIDAPHLSFEMQVSYITKLSLAKFLQQSKDEALKYQKEQTNKL